MKAVIIAGGLGTRLRPLTDHVPKPIVPLANYPMITRQIDLLVRHGITEIIVNLHYLSHEIKKILGDGKRWGAKLYYSIEKEPLGTAGAVKNAEEFFDGEPLIIFNGDVLTDLNLGKLIAFHNEQKATVTLTLVEVEDPTSFGLVLFDQQQRVTQFLEKPSWGEVNQAKSKAINAGTYVVDPKIFKEVPANQPYSFERQLFPALLKQKQAMLAYVSTAYWLDIGNPEKYKEAHQAILRGEVAVRIKGTRINNHVWVAEDAKVDKGVKLFGPCLIGEKVTLGKHTEVRDYVVLDEKVSVGEGCVLDRAIVWAGSKIGSSVVLSDCILGKNCVVEDQAVLRGVVLADGTVIKSGSQIN